MRKESNYFHRFLFLFVFSYLILYTSSILSITSLLLDPLWQLVIPQFAKLIDHQTLISTVPTGSGDTSYHYYQILFFLLSASLVSLTISFYLKNGTTQEKLNKWLIIVLRYYLAGIMIAYGIGKIFTSQFVFPGALRLDQELGDFSPMGLLWTFMGYSKGYTMFAGALEFIAGMLLLHRKTLTLGALLALGVMSNVMMLNYCYDVPVKLLSTHLVLIALYLVSTDLSRIFKFFFLNKPVEPKVDLDMVPAKFRTAKNITKWLVVFAFSGFVMYHSIELKRGYALNSHNSLLTGEYIVEPNAEKQQDILDQKQAYSKISQWETILQDQDGYATVKTKLNEELYYNMEVDSAAHKVKIKLDSDSYYQELNYTEMENDRIHLHGTYKGEEVSFILRKEERDLVKRKFHWISEFPFNR